MFKCTKCDSTLKRSEFATHDCVVALKAMIAKFKVGNHNEGPGSLDPDDSTNMNIPIPGVISNYFGLSHQIGKALKPEDTHTLMPMWPSRYTL